MLFKPFFGIAASGNGFAAGPPQFFRRALHQLPLSLIHISAHGVLPVVKWKIAVVNCSNPGGVKKEARVVRASGKDPVLWAVDTTHCGILQCTVASVWGCDLLGLSLIHI